MANANFYDGVANRGEKSLPKREISEDSLRTKIILRILMYASFAAMIVLSLTKYADYAYSIYFAVAALLLAIATDVVVTLDRKRNKK